MQTMSLDQHQQQLKNQTLANIYGMFDKQNDNMREDLKLAEANKLARQKLYWEGLAKEAAINKDYVQANLYAEQAKRVKTQMQADIANAAQSHASANASNAAAALSRDRIGTSGKEFGLITNPETGVAEQALIDVRTGNPIATYGPATPKQLGTAGNKSAKDMAYEALHDFNKARTYRDKETNEPRFSRTVLQTQVDAMNEAFGKAGLPKYKKFSLQKFDSGYGDDMSDQDPLDLVLPENATRMDIVNTLMNDYGLTKKEAVTWANTLD